MGRFSVQVSLGPKGTPLLALEAGGHVRLEDDTGAIALERQAHADSIIVEQPAGSTSLPGTSILCQASVSPSGAGFAVDFYWWKTQSETEGNRRSIGPGVYNSGNGKYEILWTFPNCGTFPPGPPDNEQATVEAVAHGTDLVEVSDTTDANVLNGRGC